MLTFYRPSEKFISVSVTGSSCQLMCKHCKARFLKHMRPAPSPDKLLAIAETLEREGGIGMLISGGSDASGKVPLDDFYDALATIKSETDLILNLHVGIIQNQDIKKLADLKPHIISLDIVGSAEAVRNVYGLDVPLSRYEEMLAGLISEGLNVVPHITVGLDSGKESGELAALEMLARHKPQLKTVVINSLMERGGDGAAFDMLARVVSEARRLMPDIRIALGCMRERGRQIPMDIVRQIDVLVNPPKDLRYMVKKFRIKYEERDGCCALAGL